MAASTSHPCARSAAYQRYLDDCDRFSNILVGLCAGRSGFIRVQRQATLKYFQSLSDTNEYNDRSQDNEEAQLLNKLKIGTASRQALSRDNSNISSGATSYHTAQQYQNSSNENVVEQTYYTRPRTTLNVPGPSTRYQIPSYSQLHEETGDRPTSPIPIPRPRPRRQFLDLEGACAEGADLDRQKVEKKLKGEKATANIQARPLVHSEQSTGVVVQPSRLATYLTQGHKVEHCDIKEWVNDSIDAQESACSAVKKPVRQCKEYYMTENFNPLNVHRQSNYDEERKDKNMAFGLAQARRNPKTLAARKIELSRREEVHMLRAQMAEEASLAAEAYETEKARKKAEAQKAGGARTTQAYKANEIQNPELSQLADEVSDMHITTEAVASQAPDGLIRGKTQPRNPRNPGRALVPESVRKSMKMVAAAHIA